MASDHESRTMRQKRKPSIIKAETIPHDTADQETRT